MSATFVYMIGSPESTMVKIGRSTAPRRRLEAFQVGSPVALELRAYWVADDAAEQRVHRELAHARRQGEWFEFGDSDPVKTVSELLGVRAVVPRRHPRGAPATGSPPAGRRYASMAEAADYLGISTKTLRRYIADGRLTGFRVGPRAIKVDLGEVDDRLVTPVPTAGPAALTEWRAGALR